MTDVEWPNSDRDSVRKREQSTSDPVISGIGIINPNPLVFHTWWWNDSPFNAIDAISRRLPTTTFVVLISNAWSLLSRYKDCSELVDVAREYRAHRSLFPQHTIIFLANDALEQQLLHWQGVESTVFQHNGFYHSGAMPSVHQPVKDIDAIYVARAEPYKRLELMAEINSACVIFSDVEKQYFRRIQNSVSHVTFVNGDPLSDSCIRLTCAGVAEWCARSKCGLCLSDEEGAMFASIEYLLCGLPVVSTRSLGGRDAYFDEGYCIVCDATPSAVAEAVKEIVARHLDSDYIRSKTLANIMANRVELLRFLTERVPLGDGSFEELSRTLLDISHDYHLWASRTVLKLVEEIRAFGIENR